MKISFTMLLVVSYSIFPAALAGIIRIKKVDPSYYPIIFWVLLGMLNEILSTLLLRFKMQNTINFNLYVLGEALLIVWQFRLWGLFLKSKFLYPFLYLSLVAGWIYENNYSRILNVIEPYFRVCYALLVIVMSILLINDLVMTYPGKLYKYAVFLICCGFVIFFTFKIQMEIFLLYGLNCSPVFRDAIFKSGSYIHLFVNTLYLIAFLWIPRKPQFIML
jgi:hypothetical protein